MSRDNARRLNGEARRGIMRGMGDDDKKQAPRFWPRRDDAFVEQNELVISPNLERFLEKQLAPADLTRLSVGNTFDAPRVSDALPYPPFERADMLKMVPCADCGEGHSGIVYDCQNCLATLCSKHAEQHKERCNPVMANADLTVKRSEPQV